MGRRFLFDVSLLDGTPVAENVTSAEAGKICGCNTQKITYNATFGWTVNNKYKVSYSDEKLSKTLDMDLLSEFDTARNRLLKLAGRK